MVNFEINSFSFYLFRNFCFPMTQIFARKVELRFETERFFGYADNRQLLSSFMFLHTMIMSQNTANDVENWGH